MQPIPESKYKELVKFYLKEMYCLEFDDLLDNEKVSDSYNAGETVTECVDYWANYKYDLTKFSQWSPAQAKEVFNRYLNY